jgi:hypothetical protein
MDPRKQNLLEKSKKILSFTELDSGHSLWRLAFLPEFVSPLWRFKKNRSHFLRNNLNIFQWCMFSFLLLAILKPATGGSGSGSGSDSPKSLKPTDNNQKIYSIVLFYLFRISSPHPSLSNRKKKFLEWEIESEKSQILKYRLWSMSDPDLL